MVNKTTCFAVLVVLVAAAWAPVSPALSIVSGSDYLATQPGTFLDFSIFGNPFGLGVVEFEGDTIGPGDTDTIVERKGDADLTNPGDSDTIDIEMVALSLQSVAPVDIGGDLFDLDISLSSVLPSIGEMTLLLDAAVTPSGTFTSFFDVFVEIEVFEAGTTNPVQTIAGLPGLRLEGSGDWSSVAPPDAVIVTGPPGDTTANTHDPLAPGSFDFFIEGLVFEEHPGGGAVHVARTSVIPEPGTTTLLLLGALGMGMRRRWF
jgi:hypothetical protein